MNAPREPVADAALTVLVVDDDKARLADLSHMVARLGHRVVRAANGTQALEQFRARKPDLVLMDASMSSMSGVETTRRIREQEGARFVPVIYLTGRDCDAGIGHILQSGGDDYLAEPVAAEALHAKLHAAGRMLSVQRENAQRLDALERYFQAAEEEQRIASGLMHRLVMMDQIRDRAVEHRLTPALHLSGDVIAAARTPGDTLHVLLADGTGHGLAASLGVMPVVQPFYAMTQKGFSLPTIAKEVNRKVREWLPIGRFVATTLIEVDPNSRMVSVWNGGNPPVVLIDREGAELHRFVSQHVPLGILRSREMDLSFERFSVDADAQLLACSDGVIEAAGPDGTQFGLERLISAAANAPANARMSALDQALDAHLAGGKPHDDLSLVLVDCSAGVDAKPDPADASALAATRALARWRFEVELSPSELRQTDVVPMLIATLERMAFPVSHRSNLFVVLSELYNNALDHGLLELDSALKGSAGGMERYLALREERFDALERGWIRIGLEMTEHAGGPRLAIHVHDSGAGFDFRNRIASVHNDTPHGRGMALVYRLCAEVEYRGSGSEVYAVYNLVPR